MNAQEVRERVERFHLWFQGAGPEITADDRAWVAKWEYLSNLQLMIAAKDRGESLEPSDETLAKVRLLLAGTHTDGPREAE
jgi:hypothetical protein